MSVFFIFLALPLYLVRFKLLGVPFTLLEVMILITFFVWFYKNYKRVLNNLKQRIKSRGHIGKENQPVLIRYPFGIEISILIVIAYVSVFVAGFSNEALGIWKAYFFEPMLLYIVIVNEFIEYDLDAVNNAGMTVMTDRIIKYILLPLFVSSFLISVFAVYQKITGSFISNPFWAEEATRRVTSFFEYPNALGLFLGPIIMLMISYLFTITPGKKSSNRQLLKKFFVFFAIILSILAIYYAKSDGAIIGVAGALLIFGLLLGARMRLLTLVLVLVVSIGLCQNQALSDKVIEKVTLKDLSGEIRKQQWRETWQLLTSSPQAFVFGVGLANYQESIKPFHQEGIFYNKDKDFDFRRKIVIYNDKYRAEHWQPVEIYEYPHNIFLNFWVELGLLGLLLFIWIFIKIFYYVNNLLKYRALNIESSFLEVRILLIGILGSFCTIIIHGLVDVPYFKNDLSVLFWMFLAILSIFVVEEKIRKA